MAKILVVDDDPDLVESVHKILTKKNYEVITAYDGAEGLRKAKMYAPDAIVLDVMMGDKDGYKVCNELKSNPKYCDIPIILLTSVVSKIPSTNYTLRGGMETAADDYIDKPVDANTLVQRVENLLK